MRSWFLATALVALACRPVSTDEDSTPRTPIQEDTDVVPLVCDPTTRPLQYLHASAYDASIAELLGHDLGLAAAFPEDAQTGGYLHMVDAQFVDALRVERWADAASVVIESIARGFGPDTPEDRVELEEAAMVAGAGVIDLPSGGEGAAVALWGAEPLVFDIHVDESGIYHLGLVASDLIGVDQVFPVVDVAVDGVWLATVEITAPSQTFETSWIRTTLDAGLHTVALSIVSPDPHIGTSVSDRVLYIDREVGTVAGLDGFRVAGPAASWDPRADWLTCDGVPLEEAGRACAEEQVRAFAERAWRRPVGDDPLVALVRFVESEANELGWEAATLLGFEAVLTSPRFVFRVEHPDPVRPTRVDAHGLAQRMSYALWDGPPDADLLSKAADGVLHDPDVLAAEVDRMLDDPRAAGMGERWAGRWLRLDALDTVTHVSADVLDGMRRETAWLLQSHLDGGDLRDLIVADQTLLDDALADHYGVGASGIVQADPSRPGLLGHGSLHTHTSEPARTSPVRRGVFVLDALLCEPPGEPPDGVEGLDGEIDDAAAVLAAHAADPNCSYCHDAIDPIGLAFEGFDMAGQARPGAATAGTLMDGRTFEDLPELAWLLRDDPRWGRCIANQASMWLFGWRAGSREVCAKDRVQRAAAEVDYAFRDLAIAIMTDPMFSAPPEAP